MKKLQDVLQFEEDPEPHWPISFVLDNSIPMGIDDKIGILNRALVEFKEDMSTDPVALTRVEISVVTFDQEVTWLDFRPLDEFEPPELTTQGEARLSPAINTALDLMERRKQAYREAGVSYYRPLVSLVSSGQWRDTQEDLSMVRQRLIFSEERRSLRFRAFGFADHDLEALSLITPPHRHPLILRNHGILASIFPSLVGEDCRIPISPEDKDFKPLEPIDVYLNY